jgi:hypothetical protein
MKKFPLLTVVTVAALGLAAFAQAYPKPSVYPTTWELKFEVGTPTRVVVGDRAYWYLTYSVTNHTGQERVFLPAFEVLTPNGVAVRTDRLIPIEVVSTVRKQAGNKLLEQANQIAGEIRLGIDEARDGVAIWPEANVEDREFTVFGTGFSGETAKVDLGEGKEMTLFKSIQLDYAITGDPKFRQVAEVREVGRSFVMR